MKTAELIAKHVAEACKYERAQPVTGIALIVTPDQLTRLLGRFAADLTRRVQCEDCGKWISVHGQEHHNATRHGKKRQAA